MNPIAIIQARMTSTRLPGKVLADLAGKSLLERMIGRVRHARLSGIVIATTSNRVDDPVVACAERLDVGVFRGDEADVLGRMHGAANMTQADPIVRLTADCPMSDPAVIDAALIRYAEGGVDYVSNCNRRTFPDGLDVEVFSADALTKAHREARHPDLREHVTPYIRGNRPELGCGHFRRADLLAPANFGHLRFTIDTSEDLAFVSSLFARLPEGFGWLDAVALATRAPAKLRITVPPHQLPGLALRSATRDDADVLFRWLNEPDRLATSLATVRNVSWDEHRNWLELKLADGNAWIAIAVYDGISAGVVRLDREADAAGISLYVDTIFRSRGVGQAMIAAARDVAGARWGATSILARVRNDNPRSITFFEAAGFAIVERRPNLVILHDQRTP